MDDSGYVPNRSQIGIRRARSSVRNDEDKNIGR